MKKLLILIGSVTLFIVLLLYGIYCSRNGIIPSPWVGWSLIFLFFTSSISLLMILNEERLNEFNKREREIQIESINRLQILKFKYQESLLKKDGGASYWGELYYNCLYQPTNIFQQNQIQLKIQNDILSHS